jgi:hypothetical protein
MKFFIFAAHSALLLCASLSAIAASPLNLSLAESFYRHRQSPFASGQASRAELEQKLQFTELGFSYSVTWNNKNYSMQSDQMIRDIQTSQFVETKINCELLSQNRRESSAIKAVSGKTQWVLLSADDYWGQVKEVAGSAKGWLPLSVLRPMHDDKGLYITLMKTALRKNPDYNSGAIDNLPQGLRILPLALEGGFLKIAFENKVGFADINNFISKADFAKLAYTRKTGWIKISHRNGQELIARNGTQIPLQNVLGYQTRSDRGIVIKTLDSEGPQLRSWVKIVNPETHFWSVSRLEGHGDVWWKKENLMQNQNSKTQATTITTDELMKREIYSIAFEKKNSLQGIASSEGIYRTEDGVTWTLLPEFGKQNQPVAIHPKGGWFVGSLKSLDKGKTFEPFIRWDLIAEAIEHTLHKNPKTLRLTQIEATPDSQIQIHLNTGTHKLKLLSPLHGLSWSVIKNKVP